MPKRQPVDEQPTKDRQVKKIADFPEQPKRHDAKYQHTEDDRRSRPQAPKKPKTYDSDSSKSDSDSDDEKHFYAQPRLQHYDPTAIDRKHETSGGSKVKK